jgi:hypothetical protein
MNKLREVGGDLAKAAAAFKLTVKHAPEFGRDGAAEGIGQANYLEEGFKRDVGAVFGPVSVSGSNFICKVANKVPADMSKLAEQRFDLMLRIKQRKAQERKELFEDGLMTELQKKGVIKMHKATIQRLVDSYKGS